jgi:hypothetical protein
VSNSQQFDLRFVGKINGANLDIQIWIAVQQFVPELSQTFSASCYEDNRLRAIRELPRKLKANSSGSSRDQSATAVEFHVL